MASGGPLSARGGLPATTNQGQRARQGGKGGDGPDRSGALLDTPGADGGGDGGDTSPGDSPPGVAPVSGPPTWLEGVYTPTAHEGAPGRGDGTGPPPGAGACPGSGTGPHAIVGGWRYSRGRSRRGAAAPSGAGRDQDGGRGTPPPPPPAPRPSPPLPPSPSAGGGGRQWARRTTRAACPGSQGGGDRTLPAPPPPPPLTPPPPGGQVLPPVDLQLDCFSYGTWTTRTWTWARPRARTRARGPGPPPAPLTEHQRRHHGLALVRWWYRQAALVFREGGRPLRWGWARMACALAPLVGLLPGVLRLQDLLAGAWNGWWHCGHRPEDGAVWITAVDLPSGPEFGTKGATVGQAPQWRYPEVLYARAPRPDPRGSRRPYTWRQYLAPMWREETGEPLRRQTGPRRVGRWDDHPPAGSSARAAASPSSRGRPPPAGTTPWGWTGGAGSWTMTPPASPPPYPGLEATWRDVAYAVHDLLPEVSNVWWAVLPEPGEVHVTALWPDALRRAGPGAARDRMYEVFRETLRLAGDWERGGVARAPAPALPRARGGTPLPTAPPSPPPGTPALGWGPGPTA